MATMTMAAEFTCARCGSHDLEFVKEYDLVTPVTYTLKSDCAGSVDGVAAVIEREVTISLWEGRVVEEDGSIDWAGETEETEFEPVSEDLEEGTEIHCAHCVGAADEADWETEDGEGEARNVVWGYRCGNCDAKAER